MNEKAKKAINTISIILAVFYGLVQLAGLGLIAFWGVKAYMFFVKTGEDRKPGITEEQASETALTYLKEKYNDDFTVVSEDNRKSDGGLFGVNWWYDFEVVRASEKDSEKPCKYEVFVSKDEPEILGDTVIEEYYRYAFANYSIPLITDALGDIPFWMTIYVQPDEWNKGFKPDREVPQSVYGKDGHFLTEDIVDFYVYVPDSAVGESSLEELANDLREYLDDESYDDGGIYVLSDLKFEKICESNSIKDSYDIRSEFRVYSERRLEIDKDNELTAEEYKSE